MPVSVQKAVVMHVIVIARPLQMKQKAIDDVDQFEREKERFTGEGMPGVVCLWYRGPVPDGARVCLQTRRWSMRMRCRGSLPTLL